MGLLQNGYRHNLTSRLIGATNLAGWNPTGGVYNGHRTAAMRNQFAGPAITDQASLLQQLRIRTTRRVDLAISSRTILLASAGSHVIGR